MNPPHLLIIGCGDIGARVGAALIERGWRVSAMRRDSSRLPSGFAGYAGDYTTVGGMAELNGLSADVCLFTPLPMGREVAGYEAGFRDSVSAISACGLLDDVKRFLYVSSTRVYAEQNGGWVDESSPTTQQDPRGMAISAGEQLALGAADATVVRPAGVYGAVPAMLVERVARGDGSADPDRISNRIHRDDLAGLLALLAERAVAGGDLPDIVNAADDEPAPIGAVERWLADAMTVNLSAAAGGKSVRGNRRVRNERLHALGYALRYPTWREGYPALISAWRNDAAGD